jgi:hypothetical protein
MNRLTDFDMYPSRETLAGPDLTQIKRRFASRSSLTGMPMAFALLRHSDCIEEAVQ